MLGACSFLVMGLAPIIHFTYTARVLIKINNMPLVLYRAAIAATTSTRSNQNIRNSALAHNRTVVGASAEHQRSISGALIGFPGDSFIRIRFRQTDRQPGEATREEIRISFLAGTARNIEQASFRSAGPAQRSDDFNIVRETQKSPHPPPISNGITPPWGEDY